MVVMTSRRVCTCMSPLRHKTGKSTDTCQKLVLSILWSFADVYSDRLWKERVHAGLYVLVDGIGFLSFVTLLVMNGIILGDLNVYVGNRRITLLTYNTLPWAVCA